MVLRDFHLRLFDSSRNSRILNSSLPKTMRGDEGLQIKNLLPFLLLILFTQPTFSQTTDHLKTEADNYFKEEQYNLAIQYYRQLANNSAQNADVNYQLAESYRKTFNYTEAEVYFLKVYFQAPVQFPLALYYYALMLKLNGDFDESIKYFTEFIYTNQNTEDLKEYVEQASIDRAGSEMAKTEISKNNSAYILQAENINTDFNDYAPAVLDSNTLVITSGRVESNRESIDERYGEAFTDNFYFSKNKTVWEDKTKQFFNVTNSRYNDGVGCFNGKGDKYYFTVCGKDGPHCRIFLSEFKGAKWSTPIALNANINYKNFESKHPAVSKGGDTLLFSSNRSGGFGQFDIWMSVNDGSDNWGPAMNLGNTINTKLNELAPAFTTFSHVFFMASDGHQNYGGLDLYMAKRFSNGVMALYNLDDPFNSNQDDCFISFDSQKIYFSSNRAGDKKGFNIYSTPISSVISFISKLSLKNKDARSDVKLNAKTERIDNLDLLTARNEDRIEYENLTYEKKKIVDKMIAKRFSNQPITRQDFKELTEEEYKQLTRIAQQQYTIRQLENRFTKTLLSNINLTSSGSHEISVTGLLKDSLTGNLLASRKIILMNGSGEVLKITSTNDMGMLRFTNIPSGQHLYLRLENIPAPNEKPQLIDLKITESGNSFGTYENIYFDFDHYTLRPEAKQVLNDLAIFLKEHTTAQVEIYAYADDLGNDDYNLALTQKRGQAVLTYLTNKGVDQTALAIIAKGRQKNFTTNDIEFQRQFNRRVEFYLNGASSSENGVKTYILKKKSDWKEISTITGIKVEELKKLNGSNTDDVQLFQPVRIPTRAEGLGKELFFLVK